MPKFVNPDKIYPRRLGLFRNNGLVIEYYSIEQDKFKKHLIPFDPHAAAQNIVQQIMRDPKHAPFLKKVQYLTLKRVIAGETIQNLQENNILASNMNNSYSSYNNAQKSYQDRSSHRNDYNSNNSYEKNEKEVEAPSIDQYSSMGTTPVYNEDSQVLKKSQISLGKASISSNINTKKVDDEYANYEQDFQEYQNQAFQELELSQSEKKESKQSKNKREQPTSQKNNAKGKDKQKVKQKQKDPIMEQFDFIDDKPKKKKSKGKSKQKKEKKEKEPTKKKQKIKQQTKIQDEFQFL